MGVKKKAWKILKMIKDTVIIQEEDPCRVSKNRKTRYNPYKKTYELRKPTSRRNKQEELQILLKQHDNERDHIWIGDRMSEEKNPGDMRIWMQNWNGIEKYDVDVMSYQLSVLVDNNIDYFSIIENKFNQYHKQTSKKWDVAKDQIMPNGTLTHTSTPGFPLKTPYQPGGLTSGFWGKIAHRHQKTYRDKYGRWHVDQFHGKEECVKIYSFYRVNPASGEEKGDSKAWSQQRAALQYNNDDRNPRSAIIQDMITSIQKDIENKVSLIIMGDLNESVSGPEKTNEKFLEMGLINVMQEYIGEDVMPRTCNRGAKAIDHIWTTANVYDEITQAGYAPFNFIKSSDHRGLFIDLKMTNLLDENMFHLEHISKKRLRCSIPSRVKKYMDNLQAKWEFNKIEERFKKLQDEFKNEGPTEENVRKLNNLDHQITEIMIQSERKCSYVPSHSTGRWSKKLRDAIRKLITASTRRTKAKKIKVGEDIELAKATFRTADKEWKDAKQELKEVRKKSKQLRESHIQECAERNVERNENKELYSEIKRLKTIELQREQADRLHYVMKPLHKVGITSIMIPAITTYSLEERNEIGFDHHDIDRMWQKILPFNGKDILDWERITNKQDVQQLLLKWQRKHFTQACECPLGSTEWNDRLRNPQTQESILNGTFKVTELPVEVQEIFDEMKRHDDVNEEIEYTSDLGDFIAFIKGSSEKTSTSPSGRGYNHYKVLVMEEAFDELKILHGIIELARKYGVILDRWKKTVTTLMEKDAGRPKIHRMRAIHIIEAEVQFLTKLFYCKKLMQKAESMQAITDQQYGGRKEKMAQSAVLNKLMYYGIVQQQLMQAAFMDDDARNCYDRILTALSAVELRAWGQSFEEAEFSIEFLQKQEYHLKTAHGITDDFYTYSRDDPTHGSGQGIGWAGVKFTKTSDTISKAMAKNCAGMKFQDPDHAITIEKNGDLFVDDTAIGVTDNAKTKETVLEQLEFDQQKHGLYMYSAGHKLAFDKCYFYLIDFIRDGYGHRHKLIHELDGSLELREGFDTQYKPIKRLQPFASHKTLGIHIAADGNQKGQKRALKKKIEEWCQKLKTRYLNGHDTLYAYNAYLMAGLRYILCTSSLSYKDCDILGKLTEPILLNAYSTQRNCSRTVLYASKKLGGFGIYHLYHVQGFEKLKFFLHHIRKNDQTGKLIKISAKWTQLEIGTSLPFTHHCYEKMKPFITNTWLTHLWDYLDTCNIRLKFINDDGKNQGKRQNDFFLMDAIYEANISLEQKLAFNQVRLYLKVETASDIVVNNSGNTICPNIKNCINHRTSTRGWPNIQHIHNDWKDIWKTLLENIIEPKLSSRRLGKWITTTYQRWPAKLNSTGSILQIENKQYTYWKKNIYKRCDIIQEVEFTHVADVVNVRKGIKVTGSGPQPENRSHHRVQSIPLWKIRNWGTLSLDAETSNIVYQHMLTNNIMLASDGSVLDNGRAAHAYCLARIDTNEIIVQAAAPVDGNFERMTSYRAEAFGALAAITLVEYIRQQHQYEGELHVPIFIDNMDAIRTINGKKYALSIGNGLEDNNDIAIELYSTANESKTTYEPVHVKSHMDEVEDELTFAQELNCAMDNLVGAFVRNPPPRFVQHENAPVLPQQQVCLLHLEHPLVMDIRDSMILSMMQDEVIEYFQNRHNVQPQYIQNIDVEMMEKVLNMSKAELGKKVKNINHEWHTMSITKKWGKTNSALCPLCHKEPETWQHVYSCDCNDMKRCKRENLEKIKKQLNRLKTLPQITEHFINILRGRVCDFETPALYPASQYMEPILEAHNSQEQIGYEAFFKGFLSRKWYELQGLYYKHQRVDRQYNTFRWRKEVVRLIVKFGNDMWSERCTIVNMENTDTDDQRYRRKMYEFSLQMKQKKHHLNPRDYHLVQRNKKFFFQSDRSNIEMWQIRLAAALTCETNKRKSQKESIEPYVTRKKVQKKKRKLSPPRDSPKYRQTILFAAIPTQPSQNNILTQADITPDAIKKKRKKLNELVSKRKKRKRQTLLKSAVSSSLPVLGNKRSRIVKSGRKRLYEKNSLNVNKKKNCTPKAKKTIECIRNTLRKENGQDPKNKR